MQGRIIPFLKRHDSQISAVARLDLDALVERSIGGTSMGENDGCLSEGTRTYHDVLGAGALNIRHVDTHRRIKLDPGRNLNDGRLPKAVPRHDGRAVAGSQDGTQAFIIARDSFDGDRRVARVIVGGIEEALDATHRRKAPILFASVRHSDVSQLEGRRAIGARGVRFLGSAPMGVGLVHGVDNSVGGRHQPTDPSICSSMRRLSSRAYSMGSSLAMGSTKPRTIVAMASFSSRPRLMR